MLSEVSDGPNLYHLIVNKGHVQRVLASGSHGKRCFQAPERGTALSDIVCSFYEKVFVSLWVIGRVRGYFNPIPNTSRFRAMTLYAISLITDL